MPNHAEQLAQELNLSLKNVQGAIDLIDAGNTIPFIARYRKEATGSMDDQVLRNLGDRLEYLRGLDKRKEEVTGSIEAQNAMTPELQAALAGAKTLAEVEDIYRPYKPKRKTRASIARARGLQPLADATLKQDANFDPQTAANDYLNEEVPDAAAALAGAQDIIAETISDDAHCRAELRRYYHAFGMVKSVKAKDEDSVYTQYYDYTEPVAKIPGHRILALDRGEREGFLKVSIAVEAERAGGIVAWMFARKKTGGASAAIVEAAALDAYSRLIHPSLENELRAELTAKAAEGAITVFGENLRQLLLQPPIRGKTVMGLDPGYRMGCKVAVVDPTGKVLDTNVVYPVPEFKRVDQAKKTIKSMVLKNEVEVMAIGNGTAKNVILFIGDGMGDSEITVARDYLGGANGHFEGLDAVGQPAELGDANAGTGQYTTPAVLESHSTERGCYGPQGKTDGSSNDALKRCLANQLKENGGIGSISEQLLDTRADVTIGGGSKYFRQTVQGGECAGKTVWEQAKEMGYQTVENDPAAIAMIVKTAKISR